MLSLTYSNNCDVYDYLWNDLYLNYVSCYFFNGIYSNLSLKKWKFPDPEIFPIIEINDEAQQKYNQTNC